MTDTSEAENSPHTGYFTVCRFEAAQTKHYEQAIQRRQPMILFAHDAAITYARQVKPLLRLLPLYRTIPKSLATVNAHKVGQLQLAPHQHEIP
jgi:hypothetical protein